jgi:hypothetical protein
MSLWWIPAGIAAWFLVAVVVALCIGPVLGRRSQVPEAAGQQWVKVPDTRKPAWNDRQASPGWLTAGSGIARREQNVTL